MIEEVDAGRSYAWFGVAAGVRQQNEYSREQKGMPVSPSWAWEYICESWGLDFHSKSWFTPQELREVNRDWCKLQHEKWPEEFPDGPLLGEEFIGCIDPDHIITGIFIPDTGGRLQKQPFAGTLAEFVGSRDIEDRVRLVFAFDN
jgi:hypothetical protein